MSVGDRRRWDARYAEAGKLPPTEVGPPPPFGPYVHLFPTAGHALDLACGRGAGSVWLAQRGLRVVGVDVSPVAVATADDLAGDCGVAHLTRFLVADLDAGLPAGEPVDVLLCNKFRDRRLDTAMVSRLAPGGLLAVSALSEVGASAGPYRAAAGELTEAFGSMRCLEVLAAGEGDGLTWLLAARREP